MRALRRSWLLAALLALVSSAATAAPAVASGSPVVGHVYVNDNTAPVNTVAAFERHLDGSLTAVPGSPFPTGGAGTGTGIGSQGALQLSRDGRYLLAVDPGSNQLSALTVRADGTLRLLPGGVISSGGLEPVSIAVHGHLLYVANAGDGGANYTGFRLLRHGRLSPLTGSTFPLPDGSQPGDVLFSGDGSTLVGTRVGTSLIDSFEVGPAGRLLTAPGSPFRAQGPGPFGSAFRPTNPRQLFVSNAHGGTDQGTVSAFHVSAHGDLDPIADSPFADFQSAPCWVEITHDGRFLFTTNTASGSISRYAITHHGLLRLLGTSTLKGSAASGPLDLRLSPAGGTLWVVDGKTDALSGFAVRDGDLSELASSPTALPDGAAPFGIVVN